jgi:transposase
MLDDGRFMQTFNINHYGIQQRWHVVSSKTSLKRSSKQVDKRVEKEAQSIKKQLFHLQAKRFRHSDNARRQAETNACKWKLHKLTDTQIIEHKEYEGKGRPKKGQQPTAVSYQIQVNYKRRKNSPTQSQRRALYHRQQHFCQSTERQRSCYGLPKTVPR